MKHKFEVRQAGKEHMGLLRRWRNASRREHEMEEEKDEYLDYRHHYIAFEGETPVGFYNINYPSRRWGYHDEGGKPQMIGGHWLDLMYVDLEHRNRGVSSALLDHLDERFTNDPYLHAVVTHPMRGDVGIKRLKKRGWVELGNYRGETNPRGGFVAHTPKEPMLLMRKDYSKKA